MDLGRTEIVDQTFGAHQQHPERKHHEHPVGRAASKSERRCRGGGVHSSASTAAAPTPTVAMGGTAYENWRHRCKRRPDHRFPQCCLALGRQASRSHSTHGACYTARRACIWNGSVASDSRTSASRLLPEPRRASASFVSKSRPPTSRFGHPRARGTCRRTGAIRLAPTIRRIFVINSSKKSRRCRPECAPVPGCAGESQPFRVRAAVKLRLSDSSTPENSNNTPL